MFYSYSFYFIVLIIVDSGSHLLLLSKEMFYICLYEQSNVREVV